MTTIWRAAATALLLSITALARAADVHVMQPWSPRRRRG